MNIEINGRERQLRFDLNFIRNLNEVFQAEASGMKVPMGVTLATMQLNMGDYSALSDVIRCALNNSISQKDIDNVIEELAEIDETDGLLAEVIEEMGKSSVVKKQLKKAEEQSQAEE